ncbi:uncharacterized [Tachysurus ichikawai]
MEAQRPSSCSVRALTHFTMGRSLCLHRGTRSTINNFGSSENVTNNNKTPSRLYACSRRRFTLPAQK